MKRWIVAAAMSLLVFGCSVNGTTTPDSKDSLIKESNLVSKAVTLNFSDYSEIDSSRTTEYVNLDDGLIAQSPEQEMVKFYYIRGVCYYIGSVSDNRINCRDVFCAPCGNQESIYDSLAEAPETGYIKRSNGYPENYRVSPGSVIAIKSIKNNSDLNFAKMIIRSISTGSISFDSKKLI